MKRTLLGFLIATIMLVAGSWCQAATDATFEWGVVSADCATVRVYQSATSGVYTYGSANAKASVVGSTRTAKISGIVDGTWYWVGTCVDAAGNESGPSPQATATFDSTAPNPPPTFKINLTVNVTVTP
jgi:hypothetical protein